MRTIWKYRLDMAFETVVEMPAGATVLTFQNQGGAMTFWAIVDTDAPMEKRTFHVVKTGSPFPDVDGELCYMGTVQGQRGYVWHIFEERNDEQT